MEDTRITDFIERWKPSGGAERANYQFSRALRRARSPPSRPHGRSRTRQPLFVKNVVFDNGDGTTSTRRIDLYRRCYLVCETKLGVEHTPT